NLGIKLPLDRLDLRTDVDPKAARLLSDEGLGVRDELPNESEFLRLEFAAAVEVDVLALGIAKLFNEWIEEPIEGCRVERRRQCAVGILPFSDPNVESHF